MGIQRSTAIDKLKRKFPYMKITFWEKVLDFMVDNIGMSPPFSENACYMDGDNANQESILYCQWETEDDKQE